MSILDQDFENTPYAEVAMHNNIDEAHDKPSSVVQSALAIVSRGSETAATLRQLIDQKGLGSKNAAACRTMVSDYLIGLDDLRTVLNSAENGDQAALERIPGIVAAIQESFAMALSEMKAYTKRDGTRALPAYVKDVYHTLFDSIRPLSGVLGVQIQTWNGVNAVGNYKFHETKPRVAKAPTLLSSDIKNTWFKTSGDDVTYSEPTRVRGSVVNKIVAALGDLTSSIKRRLPIALAGALLSVGCGEPKPAVVPVAPTIHSIPTAASPAPEVADWKVTDLRDITHGIRSALKEKCPGLTRADLIKAEGPMVHQALMRQTSVLMDTVDAQESSDVSGEWLRQVSADEARYGNVLPSDYPGVKGDLNFTRIAGAHGLDSDQVRLAASRGLPDYDTYSCPTY